MIRFWRLYTAIATPFFLATTAMAADPIVKGAPGSGFDVTRYDVTISPDFDTQEVSGHQTIELEISAENIDALVFSPNDLTIGDAEIDGQAITVSSDERGIVFRLPQTASVGEKITIKFSIAGRPKRGVTFDGDSVFTGYFACDWMVCLQDSPGDKALLNLDLIVPEDIRTIGVGSQAGLLGLGDGREIHRWQSRRPTSPYLFAFAAGKFEQQNRFTSKGDLIYLDATGNDADLNDLFAETPAMVEFFASRAGMELPEGQYAQLLVPGRVAQETMGFSLIGADELAREKSDPQSAWIIAHELAHQWWGNLVTAKTWKDFWLNEGIATFMVAAWEQHRYGEDAYRQELDVFRERRAQLKERGFDKPLTWTGKYPSIGYRRAVQYSKGALFLAELRQEIGDGAFWAGLRDFTLAHAGGSVTSRDFQAAMERAGDRELTGLFDEWVYGPGNDEAVEAAPSTN